VPVVLDASAALKWFLADERDASADALLARVAAGEGVVVPSLFLWEMQNALLSAERAGRLDEKDVDAALEALSNAPIAIEAPPERFSSGIEMQLGRAYGLTAYDAAYIATALRIRGELVTADTQMAAAARDLGIPTTGP
jgi:predicted nucleic acid-binding protein